MPPRKTGIYVTLQVLKTGEVCSLLMLISHKDLETRVDNHSNQCTRAFVKNSRTSKSQHNYAAT